MPLQTIYQTVAQCTKCPLCQGRTNTVPGVGPESADLMFIGEGPGEQEDKRGLPFVGPAGKFLDEMLSMVGLNRNQVYIANVVKCRPPGNRDPLPEEVEACWPYLEQQIRLVRPKMIITLGRHSTNRFLPDLKISAVHGQPKIYWGIDGQKQLYYPLYHPAAALHNPRLKGTLIEDFQKIPYILKKLDELIKQGVMEEGKKVMQEQASLL